MLCLFVCCVCGTKLCEYSPGLPCLSARLPGVRGFHQQVVCHTMGAQGTTTFPTQSLRSWRSCGQHRRLRLPSHQQPPPQPQQRRHHRHHRYQYQYRHQYQHQPGRELREWCAPMVGFSRSTPPAFTPPARRPQCTDGGARTSTTMCRATWASTRTRLSRTVMQRSSGGQSSTTRSQTCRVAVSLLVSCCDATDTDTTSETQTTAATTTMLAARPM